MIQNQFFIQTEHNVIDHFKTGKTLLKMPFRLLS